MNARKVFAVLVLAAGLMAVGAPVANAGPTTCSADIAWQTKHNNTYVDTTNASAVDSYNREADAIDAAIGHDCNY